MVKVLCIGDPHIKVNNMLESQEMLEKLVEITQEKKPDFIVCLGDVLDRHSNIHVSCLMMAEKMVDKLSALCPFYLLVGNHDRPNNSNFLTNEHPFNAMKKWPNVFVVDVFEKLEIGGKKFLFLPYVSPGRLEEAIQISMKNGDTSEDIKSYVSIFMHSEIYKCKMGAIVSEQGDKYPLDYPLAISGHIHDYDHLQTNVIYVGTPIQHSYSDGIHKCVSLFTFSEGWDQERIDLGLRKKVTIYITPNEVHDFQIPKDKDLKLVIRGDEASIKTISKVHKIQELKKSGVKVVFKTIQPSDTDISKNRTEKVTYKERLFSEINQQPHMLFWFNKIFEK
jgi:DNA repair exonuclease SbcCD nuclease subunit